ncbi:MAG: hypothetical protein IPO27_07530 [Bacteroidetes bacterium]|nr:hypothetical protein [Bacteroidota bacterium]
MNGLTCTWAAILNDSVTGNPEPHSGQSFNANLTTDTNFNVVVTDVNGRNSTSSVHIDAHCFIGNLAIVKIEM